ncbi:ParB/RepB/Spo0J family partition protein [Thermohalobacter berrensis]|uniref:Chromosome partitioning protein ParB n=1 Tax=Thermohalobacter berrensis TaxID=99594 RepID=A0A419T1U2_9FIRM|nr:ParB/RepB/Spo0J family partition protein [Thermohalobacter berrensis]RKD31381.1 chromosome partitioning protein ParB [Thermohalobacter berrensis]
MARKKRGLGKGLSALIPDEPIKEIGSSNKDKEVVTNIDISLIEPNKEQPRREFNKSSIDELAASIKAHGVLQPIIVRKTDGGYQIVAGERRWRAAQKAGLKEIPCIVRDLEQLKSIEIAIIENIQREDLNPIEEALAYKKLIEKYGLTQEETSEIVGKSRSYIANMIRLLKLDNRVIDMILNGEISSGHGKALLPIKDNETQYKIAKTIADKNLSVRETEKLVKKILSKDNEDKKDKKKNKKDPVIVEIEERLRKVLGTKVNINKGKKKGKIEIEYYSDEDLERILDILSHS